jgi:predicted component of type VI protein secretion system
MPFLELEGKPDLPENPREITADTIVGSGSQATWRLPNLDLAARHFTIRVDPGQPSRIVVAPATSQNVVVLNGRQVPGVGANLSSGDVVAAGSARFVFLADRNSPRPSPAASNGHAYLVNSAERKGYALRKRVVQIGREVGCSIVLRDPTVSRFHADVRSEGGEYVLYSMGSSGTRINDRSVKAPQLLVEGDHIQVGETTFAFTKGALPPGVRQVQFEDTEADALSRRATRLHTEAVTGESFAKYRRRRSQPMIMGLVAVLALVAAYLYMMR